jgi:hypothetical protein
MHAGFAQCAAFDQDAIDIGGVEKNSERKKTKIAMRCERSYGGLNASAYLVERFDRRTAGIGRRLEHERRYGGDQQCQKNIWSSNASAESGQPWLKTTGCPVPQSL